MSPTSSSLTTPEDWHRDGYSLPPVQAASEFQEFLDRYLPKKKDWTVLEIGACPGSHLLAIALSHSYRPTALDYLPAVRQLPEAFARFGVHDLEIIETDFLTFSTPRKFNVVMSYGFIEHFSDPEDIVRRHWALVAEGGYLVLGAPAFGPLQLALRRLILKPGPLEQTLRGHSPRVRNLEEIAGICLRLTGARVEKAVPVGHMDAWFTPYSSEVRRSRVWLLVLWLALGRIPRWLNWSSRRFSPLGLVIVRRTAAP